MRLCPGGNYHGQCMKPRPHPKFKAEKVRLAFKASKEFRDALQDKLRAEGRDMSKFIRMLLRREYPDLPED